MEEKIYYANVMTHKNVGDVVWMHPTLFASLELAKEFSHPEYLVVKTIEVRI